MPRFGKTSIARLSTCHPLLQELLQEVVRSRDCTILEGHRSQERQNELFTQGRTLVRWPDSRHNADPSLAVDVAPWFSEAPHVRWPDPKSDEYPRQLGQWYLFIGYVQRTAEEMGIAIRCGADWDGDGLATDQSFHDLAHIELLSTQKV
jgi:peptidoglycan L-alanyl-D-glutamate endopeptidase CwlK